MASGYSVHLGLNAVDPAHYGGWEGKLCGCEPDARDMSAIAQAQGFASTKVLLTAEATSGALIREMVDLAGRLGEDDILLLTYSGHGGQVPDLDNDEEDDHQDETWVLYDRMLIDDELYKFFGRFAYGVRIFCLSDSCHSGTVIKSLMERGLKFDELPRVARRAAQAWAPNGVSLEGFNRVRLAPPDITLQAYMNNELMYKALQAAAAGAEEAAINAGVLLISACLDNEVAYDGTNNGLFTTTLKHVWNNGAFDGDYGTFHRNIKDHLVGRQTPNLLLVGAITQALTRQKPFTI